jgi:hypothetical protein
MPPCRHGRVRRRIVLPIKLASDVARAATGTDKQVIAVSGEVEALDGVIGQR